MVAIVATTKEGQRLDALAEWAEAKAAILTAEITTDLGILDGSPTNADVIAIVRRDLVRQRKLINGIVKIVKNGF